MQTFLGVWALDNTRSWLFGILRTREEGFGVDTLFEAERFIGPELKLLAQKGRYSPSQTASQQSLRYAYSQSRSVLYKKQSVCVTYLNFLRFGVWGME